MTLRKVIILVMLCLVTLAVPALAAESFINLTEYTETGRSRSLPADCFQYDVDLNSSIDVHLNPGALVQSSQFASATSSKLAKEVESLSQLLAESRDHLQDYVSGLNTLYTQLQKSPSPALEKEFRQQLANHGALVENLLDLLEPVVGTQQLDEALSTPDPLYTDLFALLATYIKDVQKRLSAENLQIIRENKLTINIWCIHQSKAQKPSAIHLNNYDSLESGTLQMVSKFALTPADQANLRDSLRFHEDLREMLTELPDREAELKNLLGELRKQLTDDLNALKDSFRLDDPQKIITGLQKILEQIPAGPTQDKINQCLTELNTTYQQFTTLEKTYNELRQTLSNWSSTDPLKYYTTVMNQLHAFRSGFDTIFSSETEKKITELAENLDTYLVEEASLVPAALKEQLAELPQEWSAYFTNMKTMVEKSQFFTNFVPALTSLLSRLSFTEALGEVPVTTGAPEEIRQVALADAPTTIIDIPRTLRQEGDTYTLYVRVSKGTEIEYQKEYTFRVKRFGVYTNWNSSMVFAKGEKQNVFQPATGVSWLLHYRPRTEQGRLIPFFSDIVNPGIGLNSTMFYTNTQIEYGLGVTMTLFNDIIQVGYGINFQRTDVEGRCYWFVGASLFNFLKQDH